MLSEVLPRDYVENTERVWWLRRMCKGQGLPRWEPPKGIPLELFGVTDWVSLAVRLQFEIYLMPEGSALANAAWHAFNLIPLEGKGLVARRKIVAKEYGVTTRTIERVELLSMRMIDNGFRVRTGDSVEAMFAFIHDRMVLVEMAMQDRDEAQKSILIASRVELEKALPERYHGARVPGPATDV